MSFSSDEICDEFHVFLSTANKVPNIANKLMQLRLVKIFFSEAVS